MVDRQFCKGTFFNDDINLAIFSNDLTLEESIVQSTGLKICQIIHLFSGQQCLLSILYFIIPIK